MVEGIFKDEIINMRYKFKRRVLVILAILFIYCGLKADNPSIVGTRSLMWLSKDSIPADFHAAFRGNFVLDEALDVELQFSGASWYVIWLDGNYCLSPKAKAE